MNVKSLGRTINIVKNRKHLAILGASVCAIIVGLYLLIAISASGNSLPASRNIFTLYDTYNMTVVVVFDEEQPIVQFISPDGRTVDMDNIRYRPGSNFIQYFLPSAMPGTWSMNYDPLTNTEITTPYSVYMEHIFIRDFTAQLSDIEDGIIPVSFEVSADETAEFNYEIHAIFTAADNSIADEIMLVRGYGMLNEILDLGVDIEEIHDMGGFMLRLTVYIQHGQASIQDTAWLDLRLWRD